MFNIRQITIDLSLDNSFSSQSYFGGYEGESNETRLEVILPNRMTDNTNISTYHFEFQNALGQKIDSSPVSLVDGKLNIALWEQLMYRGLLIGAVCGRNVNDTLIAKSPSFKLVINNSPDGVDTSIDHTIYDPLWVDYLQNTYTYIDNVPDNILVPVDKTNHPKSNTTNMYSMSFLSRIVKGNEPITTGIEYTITKSSASSPYMVFASPTTNGLISFGISSSQSITSGLCGEYFTISATVGNITCSKRVYIQYVFYGDDWIYFEGIPDNIAIACDDNGQPKITTQTISGHLKCGDSNLETSSNVSCSINSGSGVQFSAFYSSGDSAINVVIASTNIVPDNKTQDIGSVIVTVGDKTYTKKIAICYVFNGKRGYSGLVPKESKSYSSTMTVDANTMTEIAELSGNITISLGDEVPGYDNEWGFIITEGNTAYTVTLPTVIWGYGAAPSFNANTSTMIRLYKIGSVLHGEWIV